MVYFCLSSSSQPSSRCIINVENPPSAHALWRHQDNDFYLCCAQVITNSSAVFVSDFLPFLELAWPCVLLMGVFIFYTAASLENGADLYPPSVSLCPHSGRPGADPAGRVCHDFHQCSNRHHQTNTSWTTLSFLCWLVHRRQESVDSSTVSKL